MKINNGDQIHYGFTTENLNNTISVVIDNSNDEELIENYNIQDDVSLYHPNKLINDSIIINNFFWHKFPLNSD